MIGKLNSLASRLKGKSNQVCFDWIMSELNESFQIDLDAIKKEAKLKYDALEVQDWFEKPSENAFVNAYVWYMGLNPKNKRYLTVVDFYPNNKSWGLFYIINMGSKKVEYSNQVGYWVGSRDEKNTPAWFPDSYSNEKWSKQSSLWFFRTAEHVLPWWKHIREWLKLTWVEKGVNDNANVRDIYIHPAGLDQSDGCFTLPYDKSEWQFWEDKILKQLMKIKWDSVVFAYDSRVFEKYKEQSKFFSWEMENTEGFGLYVIEWGDETEVRKRIKKNQQEGSLDSEVFSVADRVANKTNNLLGTNIPNAIMKNRESRWKKKEIEMIAAQIWKKIEEILKKIKTEKERKTFEDLQNNVYRVRIWFKEDFYRSKPKIRREKIDEWVSEFREYIEGLFSEADFSATDVRNFCSNKKSEYEKWEIASSKIWRQIQSENFAEARLSKAA